MHTPTIIKRSYSRTFRFEHPVTPMKQFKPINYYIPDLKISGLKNKFNTTESFANLAW